MERYKLIEKGKTRCPECRIGVLSQKKENIYGCETCYATFEKIVEVSYEDMF